LTWSFVVSDRLAEIEAVGYVIWAYQDLAGWAAGCLVEESLPVLGRVRC
jgi:hypothetical protein